MKAIYKGKVLDTEAISYEDISKVYDLPADEIKVWELLWEMESIVGDKALTNWVLYEYKMGQVDFDRLGAEKYVEVANEVRKELGMEEDNSPVTFYEKCMTARAKRAA